MKIKPLLYLAFPLLLIASFSDLLEEPAMIFEIILSFKPLYLIASILLGLISLYSKQFLLSTCYAIIFLYNLSLIVPWYQKQETIAPQEKVEEIKIGIINVLYGNKDYKSTIDLVHHEKPNILLFIELENDWFKEITPLYDILPYQATNDPNSKFEVKLLSSYPIEKFDIFPLNDPIRLTMTATILINKQKVDLVIPHLPTPTDLGRFQLRSKQLNSIAEIINTRENPKILIGDFNTTIWSPYYKKFIAQTNLENSRKGFGPLPTWYAISPAIPLLDASIDQILFSKEFKIVNSYLGKDIGSDHLPLFSVLSLEHEQKP